MFLSCGLTYSEQSQREGATDWRAARCPPAQCCQLCRDHLLVQKCALALANSQVLVCLFCLFFSFTPRLIRAFEIFFFFFFGDWAILGWVEEFLFSQCAYRKAYVFGIGCCLSLRFRYYTIPSWNPCLNLQ